MCPVQTRTRRATTQRVRVRLAGLLGADVGPAGGLTALPWVDGAVGVDEEVPLPSGGSLLPPAVRGGRLALDGRGAAALATVAACAVLLACWFAWRSSSVTTPAVPTLRTAGVPVAASAAAGSTGASSLPSAPSSSFLVVDVAGRVRHPGLVRLPPGARVADALTAAGGALPGVDLTSLNLAQPLTDGQQVVVAAAGAAPVGGAGNAGTGGASAGGIVDLNTATVEQLDALPGVGQVLAQRILDWRAAHGRFTSVDELSQVGGIGVKKLADISPKVRV